MTDLWEKVKKFLKSACQFLLNPHLLLCFGIAWIITNGWAYIVLGLGLFIKNEWLIGIATGYLTILWIPFTPEKIITVIIAMFLLKLIFPNDKKTLQKLHNLKESIKFKHNQKKENKKHSEKK